jgi:hypothetical protein
MTAPANVNPKDPDTSDWTEAEIEKWQQEARQWKELNPGNVDFYALTIKAGYVIGIIYDICESVSCMLRDPRFARRTSYIPAYGILASGVEILGRCVKGETRSYRSTLKAGFKWLARPDSASYSTVSKCHKLITTSQRPCSYTIEELMFLRNYAAHGQATAQFCDLDFEIIRELHPVLRDGLQSYWSKLKTPGNDILSTNLAKANIIALRDWPVFKCWSLFSRDREGRYPSVTQIFERFGTEWTVSAR